MKYYHSLFSRVTSICILQLYFKYINYNKFLHYIPIRRNAFWSTRFIYFYFYFFNFQFFIFLILKSLILSCVPKHEPPSHLPPHNISVGHPHAPAPSMLYPASDIEWRFNSYMIVYMLECHSPKSSHPLPLPLSPKVRYTQLCLFSCHWEHLNVQAFTAEVQ